MNLTWIEHMRKKYPEVLRPCIGVVDLAENTADSDDDDEQGTCPKKEGPSNTMVTMVPFQLFDQIRMVCISFLFCGRYF